MKASDYKKLAAAKQAVEEVTLPSGAVFKLRMAPIKQWVMTGVLPASLAVKMEAAAQAKGDDKNAAAAAVLATFTEEDFEAQQRISRRLLEFCCVDPKISVAGDDPDALSVDDLTEGDVEFLIKWMWSGGKAGESLDTFRQQSA